MIHAVTLCAALALGPQHVHAPAPPAAAGEHAPPSALTAEMVKQLLDGEGMGLARPAELNRYPGPKHLLDLATDLQLTSEQQQQIARIREEMLVDAKRFGRAIVDAEHALDAAFRSGTITPADLDTRLRDIASLQAQLRAAHLRAHLRTKPLLTPAQVQKYSELRGHANAMK